ncbi:MAG: ribonuclease Y [Chloroflexi bacterium]|nr:ribonuclease Y [Chloroflexota bacterium]
MLEGVLVAIVALALGGVGGYFGRQVIIGRRVRAAQRDAARILSEATTKQKEILLEAKEEAIKMRASAEAESRERRSEAQRQERRISQKEESLERKVDGVERRERALVAKEKEIEATRVKVEELKQREIQQLELIACMSSSEAKEMLLKAIEVEVRQDAARRILEIQAQMKDEADAKAREILAAAIQRCASDVVSETTVSVVPLPNDEMKGRLIGREGRNIRALESATGVDLIIDDTPETVTLSAFDPVRREVARIALTKLILDGRIHPARIEEVVQKSQAEVEAAIRTEGEQAAYKAGVQGLPMELLKILGRLKYRFSYGQNVLQHSLEVSYLASMIAAELDANVDVAKQAGLLHDIGKAVDHEVEGPHALIGADIAKRLSRSQTVVRAIAEHHGESDSISIEGLIVSAADAISGARPGARRESLEHYLKRLEALENVANSFEGVEKTFAIQAGREVRIFVKPNEVDDLAAIRLARDVAKKIEETLDYPGQIKVTVLRETRVVDYAK